MLTPALTSAATVSPPPATLSMPASRVRRAAAWATALVAVYKTLAGGWSHALPGPQGEAVAQRHKSGDRPELDELGEMSGYNAATLKRPLY